jgi:hypothetical protein
MKSSIFADITPCSPLKVNRRFGGTVRIHLQHISGGEHSKLCLPLAFTLVSFSANSSNSENESDMFLRNVGLLPNGLQSNISQIIEFLIITAVRTSNPTK